MSTKQAKTTQADELEKRFPLGDPLTVGADWDDGQDIAHWVAVAVRRQTLLLAAEEMLNISDSSRILALAKDYKRLANAMKAEQPGWKEDDEDAQVEPGKH